jgi:dihydroorotase-like cyclic amidohydrolase
MDLAIKSGTIAATCGGTTTILDVITPEPGQSLQEATAARRKEADGQVVIDLGMPCRQGQRCTKDSFLGSEGKR